MFTSNNKNHRRCSIVPILVGQFNDIIEWKAQILEKELELQSQRAKNFYNYNRRYSSPQLQRSATDSCLPPKIFNENHSYNEIPHLNGNHQLKSAEFDINQTPSNNKNKPIKLKRSKSQRCFSKKFNRIRKEAINNTINELDNELENEDCETINKNEPTLETINCRTEIMLENVPLILIRIDNNNNNIIETINDNNVAKNVTEISIDNLNNNEQNDDNQFNIKMEPEINNIIKNNNVPVNKEDNCLIDNQLNESELNQKQNNLDILTNDSKIPENEPNQPIISSSIEDQSEPVPKLMKSFNVLLEKLLKQYRHQFEIKTSIYQNETSSQLDRVNSNVPCLSTKSSAELIKVKTHCYCGKEFNFSEKYIRCFNCLTKCHNQCGTLLPRPCIRYVDPFLKSSKCIANFVYPRSKPMIPGLIIACCREIEFKCQQYSSALNINPNKNNQLYYVNSEMLKPVKEQCKKFLRDSKYGVQSLVDLNFDYLCGMVKYFLGDLIEPLFPKTIWKEYSFIIRK